MVGSSTILSAVAGAAILTTPEMFGDRNWPLITGLCALAASLLSGLHAAFNCDAYQEDCRRLVQSFYSLEMAYQAAQVNTSSDPAAKAAELDARFEDAISRASTSPPEWCRRVRTTEARTA